MIKSPASEIGNILPVPDGLLFELSAEFNLGLLPHKSHFSAGAARLSELGVLQTVVSCPRGLARLNRNLHVLTKHYDSPLPPYYDFKQFWTRIALLEVETMRTLADYFGLALHWECISRCIDSKTVALLKQRFGSDGYLFAVKRAQFMVGDLANYIGKGLELDIRTELHGIKFCKQIGGHGRKGLAINFCGAHPGLMGRTVLKLPAGYLSVPLKSPPQTVLAAVRTLLQKLLVKEVAPSWEACFK